MIGFVVRLVPGYYMILQNRGSEERLPGYWTLKRRSRALQNIGFGERVPIFARYCKIQDLKKVY